MYITEENTNAYRFMILQDYNAKSLKRLKHDELAGLCLKVEFPYSGRPTKVQMIADLLNLKAQLEATLDQPEISPEVTEKTAKLQNLKHRLKNSLDLLFSEYQLYLTEQGERYALDLFGEAIFKTSRKLDSVRYQLDTTEDKRSYTRHRLNFWKDLLQVGDVPEGYRDIMAQRAIDTRQKPLLEDYIAVYTLWN